MRKYSTKELIKELERGRGISLGLGASPQVEIWDAIIARLRAGDKLLGIAKRARFIISVYCKEHIDEYDKAIAEYKGKVED
jgi:hypothetical protein